jgi:hypothetical protein
MTDEAMAPWFLQAEQRLNIGPWLVAPNANNEKLKIGALRLGMPAPAILRNVKGCWNLGSCGMGCPTNAKQSMLVTTIPAALDRAPRCWCRRARRRWNWSDGRVQAVLCVPVAMNSAPCPGRHARGGQALRGGRWRHQLAGAADAVQAARPAWPAGQRTFLHPVTLSTAVFEERIEGWQGAPQTMYSDHFLDDGAHRRPHRLQARSAAAAPGDRGPDDGRLWRQPGKGAEGLPHTHALLALLRDGFHAESRVARSSCERQHAGAGLPAHALVMDGARRCAAEHGRDPVCRRRQAA